MPSSQGNLGRIHIPGKMQGRDTNGQFTNDSVVYRGRPWSHADAIDMYSYDVQNEKWKPSVQAGMRVVGYYLQTSQVLPSNG